MTCGLLIALGDVKQETHGKVMDFDAFTSTQAPDMQVNSAAFVELKIVTITAAIHQRLAPRANVPQILPERLSHRCC